MNKRQYVVCKFRLTDQRTYTYHNDGDPVKAGDEVKIADVRGGEDAWKRAYVAHVHHTKPSGFDTKEILGKAEPETSRQCPHGEPLGTCTDCVREHNEATR